MPNMCDMKIAQPLLFDPGVKPGIYVRSRYGRKHVCRVAQVYRNDAGEDRVRLEHVENDEGFLDVPLDSFWLEFEEVVEVGHHRIR